MNIAELIQKQIPAIAMAVSGATPEERRRRAERFARICLTAVRQTPKLAECDAQSFAASMMLCAQLDLEPNTPQGLAYLIPYGKECQFQIGYKGLMQLMYRSGLVASFNADVVYRGEVEAGLFGYQSGVRPSIEHHIDLLDTSARSGDAKDIVAAYAAVVLKTGEPIIRLVTRKEIDAARARNKGKAPAWATDYAAMAMKTAIKRLAAWMPQTEMVALAVESDSKADRLESLDATPQALPGGMAAAPMEALPGGSPVEQLNNALAQPQPAREVEVLPQPEPAPQPAPQQAQAAPADPECITDCPDHPGDRIFVSFCQSECAHRQGCPAWED